MALDITWSRQQQHMLMEMVYGTTTVASCHFVCGQEVTLCEFLRCDLPPFSSLLEGFQHHNLPPVVKYWKPFLTRLQIYHFITTEYQAFDLCFLLFLTSLLAMYKNEDDMHFIFLITKCLF